MSTVRVWFTTHGAAEGRPWTVAFDGARVNVSTVVFLVPSRTVFDRSPEWRGLFPEGVLEARGVVFVDPKTWAAEVRPL